MAKAAYLQAFLTVESNADWYTIRICVAFVTCSMTSSYGQIIHLSAGTLSVEPFATCHVPIS